MFPIVDLDHRIWYPKFDAQKEQRSQSNAFRMIEFLEPLLSLHWFIRNQTIAFLRNWEYFSLLSNQGSTNDKSLHWFLCEIGNSIHKLLIKSSLLNISFVQLCMCLYHHKWFIWKISTHCYANLSNFDGFHYMTFVKQHSLMLPKSAWEKSPETVWEKSQCIEGCQAPSGRWELSKLPTALESSSFNTDNKCCHSLFLSDRLSFCSFFEYMKQIPKCEYHCLSVIFSSENGVPWNTHTHTHTHSYIHIHIHTYTLSYTYSHTIHSHKHTNIHIYTHSHTHTHPHTNIHIHPILSLILSLSFSLSLSLTHTHTHTHTHTRERERERQRQRQRQRQRDRKRKEPTCLASHSNNSPKLFLETI